MAAISETFVREYFELNGFLVRQQRKYVTHNRREEEEIDFFVLNPQPRRLESALPFELDSDTLDGIERAIVVVKGWHTETFGLGVLENSPAMFRFLEPGVFKRATKGFVDDSNLAKILIVPTLPQSEDAKAQSIALLRSKGIDAVIAFRTILGDLIKQTEVNRNYLKSDLLQVIRVLKNYGFFKEPQLELFKPKRKRAKS